MSAVIISPVGVFPIPVTVSEQHVSTLEMTSNPVESGASLTDHAYRMPRKVTLEIAQAFPQVAWQALKRIQEDRRPFTVVTGLDVYRSMLVKDVSITREPRTALILAGSIQLQEVLIASTAQFVVEGSNGAGGEATRNAGGASTPSAEKAAPDTATQARASSTVHRGDTPTVEAPTTGTSPEAAKNQSLLAKIL